MTGAIFNTLKKPHQRDYGVLLQSIQSIYNGHIEVEY